MRMSANSMMWDLRPISCAALAASRPRSPPPITAALSTLFSLAYANIPSRSSMVRYTKTPGRCFPGIGGTKGNDPVAKTHASYGTVVPFDPVIVFVAVSIDTAFSPNNNLTSLSSNHCVEPSGLNSDVILRFEGSSDSKYDVSLTRLYAARGSSQNVDSWTPSSPPVSSLLLLQRSIMFSMNLCPTIPFPITTTFFFSKSADDDDDDGTVVLEVVVLVGMTKAPAVEARATAATKFVATKSFIVCVCVCVCVLLSSGRVR
mmetsp:Transcript_56549/g.137284  ORF Transcript_56549/g.137284 Transcript_56549/m.137284 type:complete len:260 (+) Transcript_56549:2795-3574(+)